MRVSAAALRLSIPRHYIDYWRKTGLLSENSDLSFADLRRVQLIWDCKQADLGLRRIRKLLGPPESVPAVSGVESTEFGKVFRLGGESFSDPELGQYALIPDAVLAPDVSSPRILSFPRKTASSEQQEIRRLEEEYADALAASDRRRQARAIALILKKNPYHSGALIEKGNQAFDQGRWNRAVYFYELAATHNPDCVEALYNTANAYFKQGKYAPAIRYFQDCIDRDPDFPESHFNLAILYMKLGQAGPARAYFDAYLELDPDSEWGELARQFLEDLRSAAVEADLPL